MCPVYNEAEVIQPFHAELRKVADSLAGRYAIKILYVVDRSTDLTLDILKGIAGRDSAVQVLGMSSRFGHQMSLLAGIDHCDADAIIMMDSDLQHPPSLIPDMLAEYEKGYDIVYTVRQGYHDEGLLKRISSRLFYRLINRLSDVPIIENAADFRLISRRVAEIFRKQIRERNQFLRGLFSWVGFRSTGISYHMEKRYAGSSKYSALRLLRFGIQGVVSFSRKPLQAAIFLGFAFAMSGFVFVLVTLMQYFRHDVLPPGWATLAILISIFSGVQLIFLGIIGEYIGAIFDEVKGRPHYIVEEKINLDSPDKLTE